MADERQAGGEAGLNRDMWTQANAEYTQAHAVRAWAAEEITWGIFDIPERQIGVLGEVADLDVIELGCGTANFSAWASPPRLPGPSASMSPPPSCTPRANASTRPGSPSR